MNIDRKLKEELKDLSLKVFGASSRWQKLVEKGTQEPMQRERTAMILEKGQPVEKTFIDRKSVTKFYTPEEVKALLTDIVREREEAIAKGKALSESILAKEAAEKAAKEAGVTVDVESAKLEA